MKRLAVIGARPAKHSMTPVMWNALFEKLGMDARFEAWQATTEKELHEMLSQIRRSEEFVGCNITIPWKEEVARTVDEIYGTAKAVGAVNTVKRLPDGKLSGYNTDGWGAVQALKNAGLKLEGAHAVVGGAGGAAHSIVYELANEGARVSVHNRTAERAQELAAKVNNVLGKKTVDASGLDTLEHSLDTCDIFLNTTSLGSRGGQESLSVLSEEQIELTPSHCVFFDVVYNPLETLLIRHAHAQGRRVVHGIEMLVMQAVKGFEYFFGKPLESQEADVMRQAVVQSLREREGDVTTHSMRYFTTLPR